MHFEIPTVNMAITSWKSAEGPGSHEFAESIGTAMVDTHAMLS